jgi:hypothetical protein
MGQRSDEIDRDRLATSQIEPGALAGDDAGPVAEVADDTTEIRAGIEQTRSEMTETIDAIQERLSPQHLKEQVKGQVRDATIGKAEEIMRNAGDTINEARYGVMETIRQNPIPAAMVGIGLGWLFMNRRSGSARGYERYYERGEYRGAQPYYGGQRDYAGARYMYGAAQPDDDSGMIERGQRAVGHTLHRAQETAGDVVSRAQETVGDVASQAQETVSGMASQAQESAGYIAHQAQYQAQRLEDRFERTLYENPLAVGAVAVALGTAVGFALPQTQRENELLGEARDNLVDRAQSLAHDTMEKVQRVAGDVVDEVQTTAQERAREQGLMGGQEQERGA